MHVCLQSTSLDNTRRAALYLRAAPSPSLATPSAFIVIFVILIVAVLAALSPDKPARPEVVDTVDHLRATERAGLEKWKIG